MSGVFKVDYPKIEIEANGRWKPEIEWIVKVVFDNYFSLPYLILYSEDERLCVNIGKKRLVFKHSIFKDNFGLLSTENYTIWDCKQEPFVDNLIERELPVLFGNGAWKQVSNDLIECDLDIFGFCFFMLSRYEEVFSSERDKHNRFPLEKAVAYKHRFLDRPIVDEYIEVLKFLLKRLDPKLQFKSRQGKVVVSCDVDRIYDYGTSNWKILLKTIGGDILKRKTIRNIPWLVKCWFYKTFKIGVIDATYHSIKWMIDINNQLNNKICFYFIASDNMSGVDADYDIRDPLIVEIIRDIFKNQHDVGLHPGYYSVERYSDYEYQIASLTDVVKSIQPQASIIKSRQHYLRWDPVKTATNLDSVGIKSDSTLAFAESPGFRCGTAIPYPMFDLIARKPLGLIEHPLVFMDVSAIGKEYLALENESDVIALGLKLKQRAMRYGGDFTILWHNSNLTTEKNKRMYVAILKG